MKGCKKRKDIPKTTMRNRGQKQKNKLKFGAPSFCLHINLCKMGKGV